jgi:hypothetical protein
MACERTCPRNGSPLAALALCQIDFSFGTGERTAEKLVGFRFERVGLTAHRTKMNHLWHG